MSYLFKVFAWGDNRFGQLGQSGVTYVTHCAPKLVNGVSDKRIVCIGCCKLSSVAVTDKGKVYIWGRKNNDQLGVEGNVSESSPCKVSGLRGIGNIIFPLCI